MRLELRKYRAGLKRNFSKLLSASQLPSKTQIRRDEIVDGSRLFCDSVELVLQDDKVRLQTLCGHAFMSRQRRT
jgi:hypothetical protein